MRIALVSPYSWTVPGGVNDHVANLATELDARGHETWIIAPAGSIARSAQDETFPERFISAGTAVPFRSNGSKAYVNVWPLMLRRMERILADGRFDLVHTHEPCTPFTSAAAVFVSESPVVGTFHAAGGSGLGYKVFAGLARRVVDTLAVRIVVSEAAREYVGTLFPAEYRVIPNGVDVDAYAPARRTPKVAGRVLFIGRPEPRKGLFILLQAFQELRRKCPDASLVLVGTDEEQLRTVAGKVVPKLPVPIPGVNALGRISREAKIEQMGQAETLVVPSLKGESFGIVLTEGLAAGLPVVASDIPAYRSVLQRGAAGLLVPPGDPYQLADELARVLADRELRSGLTGRGTEAVQQYAWGRVADQVVEAYEDALDRARFLDFGERATGSSGRSGPPRPGPRR
jgi:phosphatidylinositol alpha-mannosyltransferase